MGKGVAGLQGRLPYLALQLAADRLLSARLLLVDESYGG
jgi:hypothetical protein